MSDEGPKITNIASSEQSQPQPPKQEIAAAPIASARATGNTTTFGDANGRTITIKKMDPVSRMRLLKAVGPTNSKNEGYMGYAALAACVTHIDNVQENTPTSEAQIEAMVARLGEISLDAIADAYYKAWPQEETTGDRDQVKN
jgi:hypothetical protein